MAQKGLRGPVFARECLVKESASGKNLYLRYGSGRDRGAVGQLFPAAGAGGGLLGKGQGTLPPARALLMEHPALRRCFYKIAKGCCTVRSCAAAFFQVCFRSVTAVYFWQEKCYDTS